MDAAQILSQFPHYRAASPDRQQQMLADVGATVLPQGTATFVSGAPCSGVAFVGSGRLRVAKLAATGREISLYHVGAGETCLLTLSCALTGDPYAADGIVDETVEAAILPVERFRRWFDTDRGFRDYVIRTITGRVVELMQLVEDVAFRNVGSRLARYLLDATAEHGGGPIPATHDDIAAELGSSRETVSRLLKDYERHGLVQLSRGSVSVVDLPALAEQAGYANP